MSKFDITTGHRSKAIYLQDTKKGDNISTPLDLTTFEFYQHTPLATDGIKHQAMAFRLRVVIHFQALKEDKDVVHIQILESDTLEGTYTEVSEDYLIRTNAYTGAKGEKTFKGSTSNPLKHEVQSLISYIGYKRYIKVNLKFDETASALPSFVNLELEHLRDYNQ